MTGAKKIVAETLMRTRFKFRQYLSNRVFLKAEQKGMSKLKRRLMKWTVLLDDWPASVCVGEDKNAPYEPEQEIEIATYDGLIIQRQFDSQTWQDHMIS